MDGHFVPNITFGPLVVQADPQGRDRAARRAPDDSRPRSLHRGIRRTPGRPESRSTSRCCRTCTGRCISSRSWGRWRVSPSTRRRPSALSKRSWPTSTIVLVMSVNPGFGGQTFIPRSESKVRAVRQLLDREGSRAPIGIDGGIDSVERRARRRAPARKSSWRGSRSSVSPTPSARRASCAPRHRAPEPAR